MIETEEAELFKMLTGNTLTSYPKIEGVLESGKHHFCGIYCKTTLSSSGKTHTENLGAS